MSPNSWSSRKLSVSQKTSLMICLRLVWTEPLKSSMSISGHNPSYLQHRDISVFVLGPSRASKHLYSGHVKKFVLFATLLPQHFLSTKSATLFVIIKHTKSFKRTQRPLLRLLSQINSKWPPTGKNGNRHS